jgi:predicted GNAT family N-acyltransferase
MIEKVNEKLPELGLFLIEDVFYKEQNIPKTLIPLRSDHQIWWCVRRSNQLVGVVAAWEDQSEWHWGRLAIDKEVRGLGLGKKLVIKSLDELFQMGIEKVVIDARDITVRMVENLGGKITGKKVLFYGNPITPMELRKSDYLLKTGR